MIETVAASDSLELSFSGKTVRYYFDASIESLGELIDLTDVIFITDENVAAITSFPKTGKSIVIPAGEQFKQQSTVDDIIRQLIELEATRQTLIIGVGGGVVTDIAGYAASVYMRGIRFGFVPTTILAQVDASIGGKNGIDAGVYKNLVGLIRQPEFIFFDHSLLHTLPELQWINGFAEIIKHAAIADREMFDFLEQHSLEEFRSNKSLIATLIRRNVLLKSDFVQRDEFEKGDRKMLNFGHTIGHAIENIYELPHGFAVSIGMVAAARLSARLVGFAESESTRLVGVLKKYGLPVSFSAASEKVMKLLKMDKKRVSESISFVLLKKLGQAEIKPIPVADLEEYISEIF